MKKIFTILCVSLLSVGVFAQAETEAGTFLMSMGTDGVKYSSQSVSSIEGQLGYWYGSDGTSSLTEIEFDDQYDKYNVSSFGLKTHAGYFVADGFMIGLGLGYESTSTSIEYTSDFKDAGYEDNDASSSSFTLTPIVRYYIGESGIWSQLAYHLTSQSADDDSWDSSYDPEFPKTNTFSIRAGYMASLNDYVSLNPSLGYNMSTITIKDAGSDEFGEEQDIKQKSGIISFALQLNVNLGW